MVTMLPILSVDREEFLGMAVDYFSELNSSLAPHDDWKESHFPTILSRPGCFLRWIICDGRKVGFILFGVEDHRFLPRKTGAVYELYVLPEFRRRGIARTCALEAIKELWTYAPSKIELEVVEDRVAAAALWKSLGFQEITERFVLARSTP